MPGWRKNTMRKFVLAAAILIAVALFAAGCGKSEKTVYNGAGGKVSVEKGRGDEHTTNVETKEGKATVTTGGNKTITEAELGAPVYPGAKVEVSSEYASNKGDESASHHLLSSTDSFEKVADFYKNNLKNVSSQQNVSQGDSKMAMFSVGKDKVETMVHVIWDSNKKKTMIQVVKQGK